MPPFHRFARPTAVCSLGMLLSLTGCSKAPKEVVIAPAGGTVLINGQPAENIMVQFLPQVAMNEPGPTSTGISDRAGRFQLETTDGRQGAVVGRNKVLFIDTTEERVAQGQTPKPSRLPPGLATPGSTSREVEVKLENASFDFDIPK